MNDTVHSVQAPSWASWRVLFATR